MDERLLLPAALQCWGGAMIPPIYSLVLYDKPILVSSISVSKKNKSQTNITQLEDRRKNTATEDILHSILPPRWGWARGGA